MELWREQIHSPLISKKGRQRKETVWSDFISGEIAVMSAQVTQTEPI
jgi:hypothetical protein